MAVSNLIRSGFSNKIQLLKYMHRINIQIIPVRSCGWVCDYKPGPYPRTPEEREAAAQKYNLIPEDYEPYEEGSGYGDYPKLPILSQDAADPYEDFDFYSRRRNYGQTLHIHYDMMTSERSNPNKEYPFSFPFMLFCMVFPFILFAFLIWVDRYFDLRPAHPRKPKQYYNDGKPHYTFEPEYN